MVTVVFTDDDANYLHKILGDLRDATDEDDPNTGEYRDFLEAVMERLEHGGA